ncbi:MAG: DUF4381 domain-containing protein [Pseudomonadales bacterium]|nr:DUF4381 domain-containing protein [Pseudomonadales bacterium]
MADSAPVVVNLRDIHLPDPVSFFPLPVAWWVLLVVVLCVVVCVLYFLMYARKKMLRYALVELDELQFYQSQQTQQDSDTVMALGVLMKRYAQCQFPRNQVAHLWGQSWLAFLRSTSSSGQFDGDRGAAAIRLPYQKAVSSEEAKVLFESVRSWMQENPHRRYRQIRI